MPFSIVDLEEHLETDLPDTALQRVLDDAEAFIASRFGAESGTVTEYHDGGRETILPHRQATAITSITETATDNATVVTLAANDYRIRANGRYLERLGTGSNPRRFWGHLVTIVYTPDFMADQVTQVKIDLCKLAIAYEGRSSEVVGDYQSKFVDSYAAERERIVMRLHPQNGVGI